MSKVVVAGTIYLDLVLPFTHLPKPGETVVAEDRKRWVGGKGANQAAMCRRLGAEAQLLGTVGSDADGEFLIKYLSEQGVDCSLVARHPSLGTGLSVIAVDQAANNMILSHGGANVEYPAEVRSAAKAAVGAADALLLHAEFPAEAAKELSCTARERGVPVFVTPAPPERLQDLELDDGFFLFPNQTEAEILTGVKVDDLDPARRAGRLMMEQFGVGAVVLTLGAQGALITGTQGGTGEFQFHVPAMRVEAVDATAAGDAFCAAFTCCLLGSGQAASPTPEALERAARFAAVAGALTASRPGAVASLPSLGEIERHLDLAWSP